MEFMYTKINIGPETDPWGTLVVDFSWTDFKLDFSI